MQLADGFLVRHSGADLFKVTLARRTVGVSMKLHALLLAGIAVTVGALKACFLPETTNLFPH
jgi:hypothetical protein